MHRRRDRWERDRRIAREIDDKEIERRKERHYASWSEERGSNTEDRGAGAIHSKGHTRRNVISSVLLHCAYMCILYLCRERSSLSLYIANVYGETERDGIRRREFVISNKSFIRLGVWTPNGVVKIGVLLRKFHSKWDCLHTPFLSLSHFFWFSVYTQDISTAVVLLSCWYTTAKYGRPYVYTQYNRYICIYIQ